MNSIIKSNFLSFWNEKAYYEKLSMFVKNAIWSTGAEGVTVEDLIGEYPTLRSEAETKRSLTEEDIKIIEMAKEVGLDYKITSSGIKLG